VNTELKDGDSAWHRRHPQRDHFPKKFRIPFGSLTDFRPDMTQKRWKAHNKFAPNNVPSIFLGWYLHSGHAWRGEYLVASLVECRSLNLRYDVVGEDAKLPVHRVRELLVPAESTFPLKARYDQTNRTLEVYSWG